MYDAPSDSVLCDYTPSPTIIDNIISGAPSLLRSLFILFLVVLGTDYEFTSGSSVTFEPADFTTWPLPDPMCLNVSLLSDEAIEGDHTFQLFISSELSEPEITPGDNATVNITIYDLTSMN